MRMKRRGKTDGGDGNGFEADTMMSFSDKSDKNDSAEGSDWGDMKGGGNWLSSQPVKC